MTITSASLTATSSPGAHAVSAADAAVSPMPAAPAKDTSTTKGPPLVRPFDVVANETLSTYNLPGELIALPHKAIAFR